MEREHYLSAMSTSHNCQSLKHVIALSKTYHSSFKYNLSTTFLQHCSHQCWMGSINLIKLCCTVLCCQLARQHQMFSEKKSKAVIQTRPVGHGALTLPLCYADPHLSHAFTCLALDKIPASTGRVKSRSTF